MTPVTPRTRRTARFAVAGGLMLGLMAPAATAQPMATGGGGEEVALRQACGSDVQTLCPGIQPGGGKLKACLKAHSDKVSIGCKKALVEAKRARSAGQGASGAPPATP